MGEKWKTSLHRDSHLTSTTRCHRRHRWQTLEGLATSISSRVPPRHQIFHPPTKPTHSNTTTLSLSSALSTITVFLKRPHAFPFLLFVFVLLTWISLRFQQNPHLNTVSYTNNDQHKRAQRFDPEGRDRLGQGGDVDANLVRFSSLEFPSQIFKDKRGWLLNPVTAAQEAGITGGAQSCISVHVGEIRPGGMRGNHRHHACNETFIIWGAETKFRLENPHVEGKGYSEVTVGFEEVAVAASSSGTAHALVNIDPIRTTFFLGCQDCIPNYNSSRIDFNTWDDL